MAPSKLTTDARKKLAANLQVLRRYDRQIESIIDTASHVVLYEFQAPTKEWVSFTMCMNQAAKCGCIR